MSVEEYREAGDKLCNGKLTLRDYRELITGWELDDVNEFLHTKGSRLNTKNMRLKRESDIRITMMHLIEHGMVIDGEFFRIRSSGISCGGLDYGYYQRQARRRKKKEASE